MFSPKDFVPDSLKSRAVYQFTHAIYGARYNGVTNRHFTTRVYEHLFRKKISSFLNSSVLLKVVGIRVIFLVLRFSIIISDVSLSLHF